MGSSPTGRMGSAQTCHCRLACSLTLSSSSPFGVTHLFHLALTSSPSHISLVRRHHRCWQLLQPILFVIIIRVEHVHAGGACCCSIAYVWISQVAHAGEELRRVYTIYCYYLIIYFLFFFCFLFLLLYLLLPASTSLGRLPLLSGEVACCFWQER